MQERTLASEVLTDIKTECRRWQVACFILTVLLGAVVIVSGGNRIAD